MRNNIGWKGLSVREREFDPFMLKFIEVDITEYNESIYQPLIINKGITINGSS